VRERAPDDLQGALVRARGLGPTDDRSPSLVAQLDRAFEGYEPQVRWLVRRRLAGVPDAVVDEVVQEALAAAWSRIATWRPEGSFRAWLFGVTRNVCRNHRRKRRDELTPDGSLEPEDTARSALAAVRQEEREQLLMAACATLTPEEQELVYLRLVEELPRSACAVELGLDGPDAVRVAYQRCRRRLETELRRRLDALGHTSSLLRASDP
jgi:RNA polymerase sigma-70 factor, ECF subfamily